jgi:glycosyltransferase involved in cell wall biosynthesis
MNKSIDQRFSTVKSPIWDRMISPDLSIVVPFHQYDATPLLVDLTAKLAASAENVELVLLDDGSPDESHFERIAVLIRDSAIPVKAVRSHRNLGRSGARNALVDFARAPYLLFLDSDMLPDRADYLERYLAEIHAGTVFAYGGRSVARCGTIAPEHELHWYFTKRFEQLPASTRAKDPAVYFLSSNFIVRRDIIQRIPLDARFTGWGWEDCEWAHRVIAVHPLKHINNSATHLGLIDLPTIRSKYQESVLNFALVLRNCPELVNRMALYRAARKLSIWQMGNLARFLSIALMETRWLPLALRARALQIYKAALYSDVFRPQKAD